MIRLFHADGKLPNLALMRLASHLRTRGEAVDFVRGFRRRTLFDAVCRGQYGSSIFAFSAPLRARIDAEWGDVYWGGTGVRVDSSLLDFNSSVDWDAIAPDYSLYPAFTASLGFLTRGCRLRCGFCVVPEKEGKPRAASTVHAIWRGEPWPRHLHLLDNDAFAPQLRDHWRGAVAEIRAGGFDVCFSQGINLRLVDDESAALLASIRYTSHDFGKRRLFTAWDNLRDEDVFRRGIATLGRAGIPASHLTVYMLVGYRAGETFDEVLHRFNELVALGCEPYPMVFDRDARPDLCAFQRWALRHLYRTVPWAEYRDPRRAIAAAHAPVPA